MTIGLGLVSARCLTVASAALLSCVLLVSCGENTNTTISDVEARNTVGEYVTAVNDGDLDKLISLTCDPQNASWRVLVSPDYNHERVQVENSMRSFDAQILSVSKVKPHGKSSEVVMTGVTTKKSSGERLTGTQKFTLQKFRGGIRVCNVE